MYNIIGDYSKWSITRKNCNESDFNAILNDHNIAMNSAVVVFKLIPLNTNRNYRQHSSLSNLFINSCSCSPVFNPLSLIVYHEILAKLDSLQSITPQKGAKFIFQRVQWRGGKILVIGA